MLSSESEGYSVDKDDELEQMARAIAEQRGCSIELAREAARDILAEQDDVIGLDDKES